MRIKSLHSIRKIFSVSALVAAGAFAIPALADDAKPGATPMCPSLGWSEGLVRYLQPAAKIPTENTPLNASDCDFHEWSWEAFVWATALIDNSPRFLQFSTPDELLGNQSGLLKNGKRVLKLGTRALKPHTNSKAQVAGAIVEADGNMLVSQNGYPVYASVHMNPEYFQTAKNNLIITGDYSKNTDKESYFPVGAAVFKATWLRLDSNEKAPEGAYTMKAEVPVLTVKEGNAVPVEGKFVTVTVALVGLHVVGTTINHPEFLWATFEHNLNAPMVPDNTFNTSMAPADKNYTFYKAKTPYTQVNISNQDLPATLTFNEKTQKFSPVTNVVLENKTGGENQPGGVQNIASLNRASQNFLKGQKKQAQFAHYDLIGTVWMAPNIYSTNTANWWQLDQSDAIGSVNLANSTAETFQQFATNSNLDNVQNCFMCHNPTSYSSPIAPLASRLIGISHVLGANMPAPYAVLNTIPVISKSCSDSNAGPIWDNIDAQNKCPTVCSAEKKNWNGQWTTTVPGSQSVCGCCTQ
ncbi:mannan-binding lectin [Cellvibrio mixtus]|uniref:mannan-binding lectin n=1 Tax=Cellvibrio mixtus TaxID=39650 RepID=UPI000587ECB3|nr:mannan-binding lectin [Cellvibrio mixtus]